MAYEIRFTDSALRDLDKLDAVAKKAIKNKLQLLEQKPLKYAKKLHSKDIGNYRWRVGNYRIIFDLDRSKIIILKIRYRKEVYKDY